MTSRESVGRASRASSRFVVEPENVDELAATLAAALAAEGRVVAPAPATPHEIARRVAALISATSRASLDFGHQIGQFVAASRNRFDWHVILSPQVMEEVERESESGQATALEMKLQDFIYRSLVGFSQRVLLHAPWYRVPGSRDRSRLVVDFSRGVATWEVAEGPPMESLSFVDELKEAMVETGLTRAPADAARVLLAALKEQLLPLPRFLFAVRVGELATFVPMRPIAQEDSVDNAGQTEWARDHIPTPAEVKEFGIES